MYTYFITPNDVKELTNISDNLSEKYILTAIREAQQTELTTVLGIHFITKLEEAVNKGEVSERYSELLDNYILYFLCYNVISKLIPIASVKIDNAGAVTTGDEKVENLSLDEVFRLQDYYTQKSDYYKMRLQRYLRANRAKYPELDCTSEIHSAYSSPIFLGGKRGKHIIRPCHGCAGHISPEKPDTPDTPEKPYYEVLYTVDGNVYDFDSYQEGERIIPAIAPEKDGYTFQYWEGLPEYMPANDITVSAVYQEIPSVQGCYTLRYRVADWREDGEITFDNMAYIPEPFEWLQCVEREYDPNTREGWAKLTHPNLTADSEIRFQKFPGHDALFMLDLSDFNNVYMTDRMFAENTTLREFYPPKGLVGMDGYDFYNCQYLSTINFATADGYKEYQPYSYPATGAFCHCVGLTAILADNQYHMYSDNGNLYNNSDELMHARYGEVTIKEGCTAIKSEALKARGLTTLTIPASVRKIEVYACSENMELTDVYFGGTMQDWANIEKDDVNTIFESTNVSVIHCSDGDCPVDYTGGGSEEPAEHKIDIFIEWDYLETRWFKTGQLIELPDPPVREGYTFQSWNAIVPGGEWFDMPEYMPDYDFEVHASYSANTYKLVYKVDGEIVSETDVEYGTGIIAMEAPVKEGYTFSGWSEIPETMPAHDVEVTGSFTINSYDVYYTLYDENGDIYLNDYVTYRYNDLIIPYLPDIPEGYTFSWDNEPTVMPAHDVTVTGSMAKVEEPEDTTDYSTMYMTLEAIEDSEFTFSGTSYSTSVNYSIDDGVTWNKTKGKDGKTSLIPSGGKVLIKATTDEVASRVHVLSSGKFKTYGNILSTQHGDDFIGKEAISSFNVNFYNSTNLVDASNLIFPSTDLTTLSASNAYSLYFGGCASLVTAPKILPSTSISSFSYQNMFKGCTSLTTPPVIMATSMKNSSLYSMFEGCTSLTTAPVINVEHIANYGCYRMFKGCSNLTNVTMLFTSYDTGSTSYALYELLDGVASTGTFYKSPNMPLETIQQHVPSGWTILDYAG